MSRLWDTPEFWVRAETDELLRDFPNTDVRALAVSSERNNENFDGDPAFAREITAELYKRAEAGIRFWPQPLELASLEDEVRVLLVPEFAGIEGERPEQWWQRM
jgi:hypothetical protein